MLNKIFENDNIIAFDKPIGLPTTYKNDTDESDCIVKRAFIEYPFLVEVKGYNDREGGLLYRLDNDTSGIIIFAKNQQFFNKLSELQKDNKIQKSYLVISKINKSLIEKQKAFIKEAPEFSYVSQNFPQKIGNLGEQKENTVKHIAISDPKESINLRNISKEYISFTNWDFNSQKSTTKNNLINSEDQSLNSIGKTTLFENILDNSKQIFNKINIPIGHSRKSSHKMQAVLGQNYKVQGKPSLATTYFRIVSRNNEYVLIEAVITKGCRHQIRVHLSSVGYPIVGDSVYNKEDKLIKSAFSEAVSNNRLWLHCWKVQG